MKIPIRQLLLPATVTGFVAGIFLTTPDMITEVIGFIMSFTVSLIMLLIFARVAPAANWRTGGRRLTIWLVAAFGAVVPSLAYRWL